MKYSQPKTLDDARNILSAIDSLPTEMVAELTHFPEVKAILDNRLLSAAERKAKLRPFAQAFKREAQESLKAAYLAQDDAARLQRHKEAIEALRPWCERNDYSLERNDCSRLHKLVEARARGDLILRKDDREKDLAALWDAQVFVVQHDWAAAFKGATDYSEGEFRLPFQHCAFEFRMGGVTIILIALQPEEQPATGVAFIECPGGYWWYVPADATKEMPVLDFAWKQIRAISIALDAEVASHDVVRAPTALNERRQKKGELPLYDYRIIKLHGRILRGHAPGTGSHRSPRLHFRRGHWRHYQAHKTWIRWTLVGDPELGFIDKAYRL
jgi:hypothetical protein